MAMQRSAGLFTVGIRCGCAGIFTPKSGSAFTFGGVPLNRRSVDRFASAIQQAHIFHFQHKIICAARAAALRHFAQNDRGVMANAVFASIAFELFIKLCSTAVLSLPRWYRCSQPWEYG